MKATQMQIRHIRHEENLKANVGKPKELWKALKSLGLPSKKTASTNICLKDKTEVTFDSSSISEIFKSFYSTLASNLVKQLPSPKNRFDLKSVEKYYSSFNFSKNKLSFERVSPESVLKTLKNLDTNKASGIDNISGKLYQYHKFVIFLFQDRRFQKPAK